MATHAFRKLQGAHVLVLGGTSGIGLAVAAGALADGAHVTVAAGALADGAHVTVASSSQARVDRAVAALQAQRGPSSAAVVQGFVCDFGHGHHDDDTEARIEALFCAAAAGAAGAPPRPLDHVVYTAAEGLGVGPLQDATRAAVLAGAHMRMLVPLLLAKVAERRLPASAAASLTLTSGQAADAPPPGWAVAVFFAGGAQALARALAVDLAPRRVNVVVPGVVDTPLWTTALPELDAAARDALFADTAKRLPVGAVGQPADVAEAYLWLMKDRFVTGTCAASNGGALLV